MLALSLALIDKEAILQMKIKVDSLISSMNEIHQNEARLQEEIPLTELLTSSSVNSERNLGREFRIESLVNPLTASVDKALRQLKVLRNHLDFPLQNSFSNEKTRQVFLLILNQCWGQLKLLYKALLVRQLAYITKRVEYNTSGVHDHNQRLLTLSRFSVFNSMTLNVRLQHHQNAIREIAIYEQILAELSESHMRLIDNLKHELRIISQDEEDIANQIESLVQNIECSLNVDEPMMSYLQSLQNELSKRLEQLEVSKLADETNLTARFTSMRI